MKREDKEEEEKEEEKEKKKHLEISETGKLKAQPLLRGEKPEHP